MKRAISLVLVFVLCLSLCACGKSKPVKEAEAAIAAIGEVTIDSGEAIKNAEKLYGILTDAEKAKVDNRMTLVDAREAFDELCEEVIYQNARDAFEKLNQVADKCIEGMDSIYGAWHFGIYEASDVYSTSADTFYYSMSLDVPNFSSDDLESAAEIYAQALSARFNSPTSTKDLVRMSKNDFNYCLYVVQTALDEAGYFDLVEQNMADAEKTLQLLTNTYEDYTYYPKLKEHYSTVKSYVDFFMSPSGSFKQLADTINNYENSIRTTAADVSFLFTK